MQSQHNNLSCYRCGASLAALSLPLARLDECPACRVQLHVCRMCTHYAPRLTKRCDEDDAPDVRDKAAANFCDYYKPNPDAHRAADPDAEAAARAQLDALFGNDGTGGENPAGLKRNVEAGNPADSAQPTQEDETRRLAEALFKK